MGNQLSRPYRPPKERPMAFLRRKFGKMTRKDKINRMVSLTFLKDEAKLHQFSEWAKLTNKELRIYYKKIDSIVGEFVTDIPEIEFRYSPEVTSDSETSFVSSASSDNSLASKISVDAPVYNDPVKQKNFEQFCLAQYGTTITVHQKEGPNNDDCIKGKPAMESHRFTPGGDTKQPTKRIGISNDGSDVTTVLSPKKTMEENPTNSLGTKKRLSPRKQNYSSRKKKKSPKLVKFDDNPQIIVTPECKEAKMVPTFNSPSRQPVMHTPVPITCTDITDKKKAEEEDGNVTNEQKDRPLNGLNPSPENCLSSTTKGMSISTEKNTVDPMADPTTDEDVNEVSVLKSPFGQAVVHTPIPSKIMAAYNTQPDECKEIPVFSCPSKQRVMNIPVPVVVSEPLPDSLTAPDSVRLPSVVEEADFAPKATSTAREPKKTDPHPKSFGHSKRKPVGKPLKQMSTKQSMPPSLAEDNAFKEIPIFKSPSKQMIAHTPVPIISRVTELQEEKPDAKEVPVFKSPSKQVVMHTPVPIIARVNEQPKEHLKEKQEVPIYLDPSRQPVQFTPVPKIAKEHAAGPQSAEMVCSPVPQLDLHLSQDAIKSPKAIGIPGSRQLTPNNEGRSRSQASLSRQAKIEGKINQGLRTTTKAQKRVKVPKCPPKIPEQPSKSVEESKVVASVDTQKDSTAKTKNPAKKPGFIKRCVDNIKRRTESALSNKQVIKVKPATPECTIENHKPVRSQPQHLKAARPKVIKKRVIPQTNLRPDKGIVWPTDFETLNAHNKSYYVEQFLRSELFKQRCKRKHSGGTTWMNGLSKFQLWVIEHEGTDAIEEVLTPVKKNKSDAKAKVQCWRDDSPEC